MAKKIAIVAVGKLKSGFWKQAADHYKEKIAKYYYLQESVVRDAPGHLSPEARAGKESAELRKKCGSRDTIICLDQRGTTLTSKEFASQLRQWLEGTGTPTFLLGGAFGLSRELIQAAEYRLSLSHLTLPHELSRILLLEQIYRAATIHWGHPYHH